MPGLTTCSTNQYNKRDGLGGEEEAVNQTLTLETKLKCREHVEVYLPTGFVGHHQV